MRAVKPAEHRQWDRTPVGAGRNQHTGGIARGGDWAGM